MEAKDRPTKKQKMMTKRDASPPVVDSLIIHQILETVVKSGYCNLPTLSKLKRASKQIYQLLESDSMWASLYHNLHGSGNSQLHIPEQALQEKGHKWLVKKLYNATVPDQQLPPLLPPSNSKQDFVFIFQLFDYNDDSTENMIVQWSVTGADLGSLLERGEGEAMLEKPIELSNRILIRDGTDYQRSGHNPTYGMPGGPVILDYVHQNGASTSKYEMDLRVSVLRLTDMKMCCVYCSEEGIGYVLSPEVDDLFGIIDSITEPNGRSGKQSTEAGDQLPLVVTIPQAILARFPYLCYVYPHVIVGTTSDSANVTVTGVRMELMKEYEPFISQDARFWEEIDMRNFGVTPLHLFSYLHFT